MNAYLPQRQIISAKNGVASLSNAYDNHINTFEMFKLSVSFLDLDG